MYYRVLQELDSELTFIFTLYLYAHLKQLVMTFVISK